MQIYPTEEQEKQLLEWCKISHNMWNFLVAKYDGWQPKINSYGIKDYTPRDMMNEFGCSDIPQRAVLGVQKTYCKAVKRFYKKYANPPKFHKYNPNKQSFYLASTIWKINEPFIYFPSINQKGHSKSNIILLDADYIEQNNITEIREPRFCNYRGKWFLSGSYRVADIVITNPKEIIGLDWGIKNFMTSSNGEFINYPKSVLREFQRISKLQSIKSKKKKGSNNYKKIIAKIQKAYDRSNNIKNNFIEKATYKLSHENSISVEKLGKIVYKNKNIRRFNTMYPRWKFVEKLKWKCNLYGNYFLEVEPYYTSQTCCNCGKVHNLSLRDRVMKCDCGNEIDRDINAAINIKNRAELTLSSNAYLL